MMRFKDPRYCYLKGTTEQGSHHNEKDQSLVRPFNGKSNHFLFTSNHRKHYPHHPHHQINGRTNGRTIFKDTRINRHINNGFTYIKTQNQQTITTSIVKSAPLPSRFSFNHLRTPTAASTAHSYHRKKIKTSINRILLRKKRINLKIDKRKYCMFFCRFGRCNNGSNCVFIHDEDKVAVCTRFVRGTCRGTDDCPFSHKIAPEKMPVCSFFLEGRCNKDICPYRHVNVSRDAAVCDDFIRGYCAKENEEFLKDGKCSKGDSCKLPHRLSEEEKKPKSQIREKTMVKKFKNHLKVAHQLKTGHENQNLDLSVNENNPMPDFIPISGINCKDLVYCNDHSQDGNEIEKVKRTFDYDFEDAWSDDDITIKEKKPSIRVLPLFLMEVL